MTNEEMEAAMAIQAENAWLKGKLAGICKVYAIVRPVLTVLRFFSFIKKGGKLAIDTAIAVLDEACATKPVEL